MSEFEELEALRTRMDPDVAARQREAIRAELSMSPRRPSRRWTGLVAAAVIAVPAAAVAAEGSVPGDVLYPVKRAVEPVVALFDDDVRVDHRIAEVEELLRRDAEPPVVDQAVSDAREAIADSDRPELHGPRLDRVTDRAHTTDAPGEGTVPDRTTTTTIPDRTTTTVRTTTTTAVRDATTTTVIRDATTTTAPVDSTRPGDRPRDGA